MSVCLVGADQDSVALQALQKVQFGSRFSPSLLRFGGGQMRSRSIGGSLLGVLVVKEAERADLWGEESQAPLGIANPFQPFKYKGEGVFFGGGCQFLFWSPKLNCECCYWWDLGRGEARAHEGRDCLDPFSSSVNIDRVLVTFPKKKSLSIFLARRAIYNVS